MLLVSQFIGGGAGLASSVISGSFREQDYQEPNLSEYTFSSIDIGPTTVSHKVVLFTGGGENGVGAVTLATVSMTEIVEVDNGSRISQAWYIDSITATSGEFVLTMDGGASKATIATYALYDAAAGGPTATNTSTADPASLNLNTVAGGFACAFNFGVENGSYTWTGLTEDFDTGADDTRGGASLNVVSASTPLTIASDHSSGGGQAAVSLSFSPA